MSRPERDKRSTKAAILVGRGIPSVPARTALAEPGIRRPGIAAPGGSDPPVAPRRATHPVGDGGACP